MKVVSLGSTCSVARQLQILDMRHASLPFDWVRTHDFDSVIDLIESGFDKYLTEENFVFVRDSDKFPLGIDVGDMGHSESAIYRHKIYDITFFHDFKSTASFPAQFKDFQEKQQRRIDRFYRLLQEEKSLLFVRDDIKMQVTYSHVERLFSVLHKINPDLVVKLLIIAYNPKDRPVLGSSDKVYVFNDRNPMGEWWRPNVPWKLLFDTAF